MWERVLKLKADFYLPVACETSIFKAGKGVVGGSFKYSKLNQTFKGKFPMKKEVQITVVGRVWNANKRKILALNTCLDEYFKAVKFFLSFNSTSKIFLHKMAIKNQRTV